MGHRPTSNLELHMVQPRNEFSLLPEEGNQKGAVEGAAPVSKETTSDKPISQQTAASEPPMSKQKSTEGALHGVCKERATTQLHALQKNTFRMSVDIAQ